MSYNSENSYNSVKTPVNKIKKIEKELNLFEDILDEERLLKERYKKRIIMPIFIDNMQEQIYEIINNYLGKSDLEEYISYHIVVTFRNLQLNNFKKQLVPCNIGIAFTQDLKKICEYIAFEDFISNIVSNYKVIIGKTIEQTLNSVKNLTEEKFNEIISNEAIEEIFSTLFDQNKNFNKEEISKKFNNSLFNELKNINKKDLCFKYFTNIRALVNNIAILFIEDDQEYSVVPKTRIKGKRLAISKKIKRPSTNKCLIFTKEDSFTTTTVKQKTIKFNKYDFLKNLENF